MTYLKTKSSEAVKAIKADEAKAKAFLSAHIEGVTAAGEALLGLFVALEGDGEAQGHGDVRILRNVMRTLYTREDRSAVEAIAVLAKEFSTFTVERKQGVCPKLVRPTPRKGQPPKEADIDGLRDLLRKHKGNFLKAAASFRKPPKEASGPKPLAERILALASPCKKAGMFDADPGLEAQITKLANRVAKLQKELDAAEAAGMDIELFRKEQAKINAENAKAEAAADKAQKAQITRIREAKAPAKAA